MPHRPPESVTKLGHETSTRSRAADVVRRIAERNAMLIVVISMALVLPGSALAVTLRAAVKVFSNISRRMPTATQSHGVPEVGPLYANAHARRHTCTASVVHSAHKDTLITAAHCVVGNGVGMVFAPGQHGTQTPFGRWVVTAALVEPQWEADRDPQADIAFLVVAPRRINGATRQIEQVTGAYALGETAGRGQRVSITGSPAGGANNPIRCAATVYLTAGYPTFDCRGFVNGTSGSPWLRVTSHGTQVVGVIGGLNEGGEHDYTSYSSPLGADVDATYVRASS